MKMFIVQYRAESGGVLLTHGAVRTRSAAHASAARMLARHDQFAVSVYATEQSK